MQTFMVKNSQGQLVTVFRNQDGKICPVFNGGAGSGNFGHSGIPGQVGGSGSGGGGSEGSVKEVKSRMNSQIKIYSDKINSGQKLSSAEKGHYNRLKDDKKELEKSSDKKGFAKKWLAGNPAVEQTVRKKIASKKANWREAQAMREARAEAREAREAEALEREWEKMRMDARG